MPYVLSRAEVANELLQTLDENDLRGFEKTILIAGDVGADLNYQYGKETNYKTILHLALEEDDGEPYVDALLKAGADVNFYNERLGCLPIHVATSESIPEIFSLLFRYSANTANVNALTSEGLHSIHLLLAQLIDLASLQNKPLQNRGINPPTDEDIEESLNNVAKCMNFLLDRKDLCMDVFDHVLKTTVDRTAFVKSRLTMKKLTTMTPLQIICSFQTWNAKPISDNLHKLIEAIVFKLLHLGTDPNSTGTTGVLAGTVPGSTPPVLLAATRGYHRVIAVFKQFPLTNFLVENKFQQNILHMVLKAGYYNKIAVHGDESGFVNVETLMELLKEDASGVQAQMREIINRLDSYGNTPIHYARPYPDQAIVKVLLKNGAKLDQNPQGQLNLNPRTLEEYFYEECIIPEGDDIDEEDFQIRINFKLFERPLVDENTPLALNQEPKGSQVPLAWSSDVEKLALGKKTGALPTKSSKYAMVGSGKVDTKRLEYFSDVDGLHHLLKHPVMTSFLEIELNSLRIRYIFDFIIYLIFVIVLFLFLSDKYGIANGILGAKIIIYKDEDINYEVTYSLIILCVLLLLLIIREIWQIVKLKKRYLTQPENYLEWAVIILAILNIVPWYYISFLGTGHLQRHLAALIMLLAFMQLYLLLVRIVPNTPIPIYINMFTTVLKTYTFILLSYLAFILSFAYSFYLVFGSGAKPQSDPAHSTLTTSSTTENGTTQIPFTTQAPSQVDESLGTSYDPLFSSIGLSLVKTLVMFVGEIDYNDLIFTHWLGYVIFVLFLFLMIIVLMNILNGLAVSDIHKIQEEVDTYYHISIVETLAYTSFVSLLAEEIVLYPNIKPENQKILGITIPGYKVYRGQGGRMGKHEKKRDFFFSENTVKAAKELVVQKQQQNQSLGRVTLEGLREHILDIKKDQMITRQKLASIEEQINTLYEVMVSRQPALDRL
ncbi:hypothetical protein TCAL_06841 [Tigriopus californicus]|uniref:Ion transport domain-containing protein n=1 Tax=Tigriopus californicus TaxID=6832 RepID=A0A553NS23_TIGCA|nr:uncharacterized protein LOC131893629 [Tigriopus californicus]TRY68237.1 hypothetical protein TCAL_06841 [Tigriopus californicus]|eukprot:TCALIF_06841-PA protein Name:"Similar to pain Transient receptor potential cation channel protein painless (Drosophila melanogaster)" AED:0.17 eAED:0.03 QI:0/0.66/0.25/0.75/1/1/4/97/945